MSTNYSRRGRSGFDGARQRGAALYVALIMLVLLALIGVAALQVTSLQERMSANYRATNLALQNAEARAREEETRIDGQVNSGGNESVVVDEPFCARAFDPSGWADGMSFANPKPTKTSNTRRIDQCVAGNGSTAEGTGPITENTNLIFQITAYATDNSGANPSSDAVIDTIFIP